MEFAGFSFELLTVLFIVAVFAGCMDTLAGGGGLISLPALFLSGIPPLVALGTNKLQGSVGTTTATYFMLRNGKITWEKCKPHMFTAFIGSVVGTIVVQFVDTKVLSFVTPLVLLCIAIYFLISPSPEERQPQLALSEKKYKNMLVPAIGFYDGMFGPGTGSFYVMAGVAFRRLELRSSTAIAKSLNCATNIASLIVFLAAGQVVWVIGLTMMLGQVIGASIGSHLLFKINPILLRRLIVLMCVGMLSKYAVSSDWLTLI